MPAQKPLTTLNLFDIGVVPEGQKFVGFNRIAGWNPNYTRGCITPRGHWRKINQYLELDGDPLIFDYMTATRYPDLDQLFPVMLQSGLQVLILASVRFASVANISARGTQMKDFAGNLYWVATTAKIGKTNYDQLNGALTAVSATIVCDDTSDFPATGVVLIDSELIRYTTNAANTLGGLTRGSSGTTAAVHSDNTEIMVFDQVTLNYTQRRGQTFSWEQRSPMLELAGTLNIGYGRQVIKIEPGGLVITQPALLLGVEDEILDMQEYNGQIAISFARNGGAENYIGFWDGISENLSSTIKIPGSAFALTENENILFAFIRNSIWIFNGSDFELWDYIPGTDRSNRNYQDSAITVEKNNLIVENNQILFVPESGSATDSVPIGIYKIGKRSSGDPLAIWCEYLVAEADVFSDNIDTNSLGRDIGLYEGIAWSYGTASYARSDNSTSIAVYNDLQLPYFITNILDLDDSEQRLVQGVRLKYAEKLSADVNFTLKISYRTDDECTLSDDTTNWTALDELSAASAINNANDILYGIYERAWRIQFKVEINSAASPTTGSILPAITALEIY